MSGRWVGGGRVGRFHVGAGGGGWKRAFVARYGWEQGLVGGGEGPWWTRWAVRLAERARSAGLSAGASVRGAEVWVGGGVGGFITYKIFKQD